MSEEAQSDKKTTAWAQMMEDASDNEEEGKNDGSHPASRKNSESQNYREPREQKQRGDFTQNMLKIIESTPSPIIIYVYNLPPKATVEDIRKIYADIDITNCTEFRKGAFTLEIEDKEEAVKLVKGGRKFFQRMPVKIRLPMKKEEGEEGLREKNQQRRTEFNGGRKQNDYMPRNGKPNFDRKRDHQDEFEGDFNRSRPYEGGGAGSQPFRQKHGKNADRPHYNRPPYQKQEEPTSDQIGPAEDRRPIGFFKKDSQTNEKKDDAPKEVVVKPNPFGQAKPRDVAVIARMEAEVEKIMEVEGLKPIPVSQEHRELRGGQEFHKSHSDHKPLHEHRPHQDQKPHYENRTHQENRATHEQKPHQEPQVHLEHKSQTESKPEIQGVEKKEEEISQKPKINNKEERQGPRPQTGNHHRNNEEHYRPKYNNQKHSNEGPKQKDPNVDDDGFKTVGRRQPVEEKKHYHHKEGGYKNNKNKEGYNNNSKNEKKIDRGERPQANEGEKKREEPSKVAETKNNSGNDQKKKPQAPTQNKYGGLGNEEEENNE